MEIITAAPSPDLRSGAGFRRLGRILFTHRHLDHVLGLAGLVSTMALFDAADRIDLHAGPATLAFLADHVRAAWEGRRPPLELGYHPIAAGEPILEEGFSITPFAVQHGGSESFGIEAELTIKFAKRRARIYETPITYRGRTYEEGKKVRARDG